MLIDELPPREIVLGLPVSAVTMDGAVAAAAGAIAAGRRCNMIVVNANKSWQAARDARLRRIIERAEMVIPEWATFWASRRLGVPGIHHLGGITLMDRLLDAAPQRGWSVYFLGAQPQVVAALVDRQPRLRPGLRVAGSHHGYLDEAARRAVHEELLRVQPDLLFVAMGSPTQEYFIDELPEAAARVRLGVGGSFDVLAGFKRDTPSWIRGTGFEWLYRLSQDPRRYWRRYLVTNTWFVWQVLRERVGRSVAGRT